MPHAPRLGAWSVAVSNEVKLIFNIMFLKEAFCYIGTKEVGKSKNKRTIPDVSLAIDLIRDCRHDIQIFGLKATIEKWQFFLIGQLRNDNNRCFVCGSTEYWYRQPSELGGQGAWVCSICHPDPNVKKTIEVDSIKYLKEGGEIECQLKSQKESSERQSQYLIALD